MPSDLFRALFSFVIFVLLGKAAADYGYGSRNGNGYSKASWYQLIDYTPVPITSTSSNEYFLYPTSASSAAVKSCSEESPKTRPHAHATSPPYHHSWTYTIPSTAGGSQVYSSEHAIPSGHSSGYAIPSGYSRGQSLPIASFVNGSYHYPTPTPETTESQSEASTTILTTSVTSSSLSQEASSIIASTIASGTGSGTQYTPTTAQSASPTQSGPAEPLFTAGGLRLSDVSVWKWNVVVSALLGLLVMWI